MTTLTNDKMKTQKNILFVHNFLLKTELKMRLKPFNWGYSNEASIFLIFFKLSHLIWTSVSMIRSICYV